MTDLKTAAQQALEALTSHNDLLGTMYLKMDAIAALKAALEQPEQEPGELTIERLRDALVASRIIPPESVEDPDGYDDGMTLFRIEALHRRIT